LAWLRDIDRWLIDEVLPGATRYQALAARLIGAADADDLVQEAYAKLLSTQHWRGIASPVAFTLQIVRNLALDRLRRASIVRIQQVAALDETDVVDDAPDAHAILAARRELAQVVRMVDELPPQCRTVLRMRKFDGLSPQAIADSLGLSVSTVEKHLAKGVATIAKQRAAGLAPTHEGVRPRPWIRRSSRP
jgi:RNA polymerase sigma factor (sigma-70 family)